MFYYYLFDIATRDLILFIFVNKRDCGRYVVGKRQEMRIGRSKEITLVVPGFRAEHTLVASLR